MKIRNLEKKGTLGITLIALVVTIVILIILATISITAIIDPNNGLIAQAEKAKELTRVAEIKEALNNKKMENAISNAIDGTQKTPEQIVEDLIDKGIVKPEEVEKNEDGNPIIKIGDNIIDVEKEINGEKEPEEILASKVLIPDPSATEASKKSPYVKYNGLMCRVLYNDSTHGLQIVTESGVESVILGAQDETITEFDFEYDGTVTITDKFKKAATSYNRAVATLNNVAKTYKDTEGIAIDARCLGSDPKIGNDSKFKSDEAEMWAGTDCDYINKYKWNYKFKEGDSKHIEDIEQLQLLEIKKGETEDEDAYQWLASRSLINGEGMTQMYIKRWDSNYNCFIETLCYVTQNGSALTSSLSKEMLNHPISPVILLSSKAIIISGDGSRENPYILGVKKNNTTVKKACDVLYTDSSATEASKKSPYVKYNGIDCRVLYNDNKHGLQIITADNVRNDVKLGYDDESVTASDFEYDGTVTITDKFKKAAASYNNAVNSLNNIAKTYMDTNDIAKDARCLGSNSFRKRNSTFYSDDAEMYTDSNRTYMSTYKWNEKFKNSDTNFSKDVQQIKDLGLNVSSNSTWLASRNIGPSTSRTSFSIRYILGTNSNLSTLVYVYSDGTISNKHPYMGLRPIFLIASDALILSGDGSSENPYVIGK